MSSIIQFQFRRGSSSQWSSVNPVLADGELAIESDTRQFKIGNGVSTWNSLAYGGLVGPPGATGTITNIVNYDMSFNANIFVGGDTSLNGRLKVSNDASLNSNLYVGKDVSLGGNLIANKIGVGKVPNPTYGLDVVGGINMTGGLYVNGNPFNSFNYNADLNLNANLFVGKDTSLSGKLYTIGDASLNSNLFVGKDVSLGGNLIANKIGVGKVPNSTYGLDVIGNINMTGGLYVNGNPFSSFNNNADLSLNANLFVGKDASLIGKLNVVGNTTLSNVSSSSLIVTGNTTVNNTLFVSNINASNLSLLGNLTVLGNTTTLNVNNLDISDNIIRLNKGSTSLLNGSGIEVELNSAVVGNILLKNDSNWYINSSVGEVNLNSSLAKLTQQSYTSGTTTTAIVGNVSVSDSNSKFVGNGDASLNRNLFVGADASLSGKLRVAGDASFNSNLFVGKDSSLSGKLRVAGDVSFGSNLDIIGALSYGSISETFITIASQPAGSYTANYNSGLVRYIQAFAGQPTTFAITNLPTTLNKSYVFTIIYKGATTSYKYTAVSINGTSMTLNGTGIAMGSTGYYIQQFYIMISDPVMENNLVMQSLSVDYSTSDVGNTYVNNDLVLSGNLVVGADFSFNSNLFVGKDASFGGKLRVAGDASLNSNLFVGKDVSFGGKLRVAGDASLNSNLFVGADTSFGGKLRVASDTSLNSNLFVGADASLNANLYVGGNNVKIGTTNSIAKLSVEYPGIPIDGNVLSLHGTSTGTNDYNLIEAGHGSNTNFVLKGTGDVSFNGNLYVGNPIFPNYNPTELTANTQIGYKTFPASSSTNMVVGQTTNIGNVTIPAGVWLVECNVKPTFPPNSSGYYSTSLSYPTNDSTERDIIQTYNGGYWPSRITSIYTLTSSTKINANCFLSGTVPNLCTTTFTYTRIA